ncbi:uncharacterized protein BYT42DRAFT_475712, partial [Radiomyces spectabilis]|uniref:uncharacterized protein n=1 Tax=Radiomyces spectabilis TaxID=64574 RepID=UPI00221E4227
KKQQPSAKRMATTARAFDTSGNSGFQYVYIPSKFRMKTKELRQRLRILGFDNSRILDVHYPDRQVVALLLHNDYHPAFLQNLERHKITLISDFNPRNPAHLRDPKFADLPANERQTKANEIHAQRLERALRFIRPPVKYAVARSFYQQQWIDEDTLRSVL